MAEVASIDEGGFVDVELGVGLVRSSGDGKRIEAAGGQSSCVETGAGARVQ